MKKTLKIFLVAIVLMLVMMVTSYAGEPIPVEFRENIDKSGRTIKVEINDGANTYEYKVATLSSEDENEYAKIQDAKNAAENNYVSEFQEQVKQIKKYKDLISQAEKDNLPEKDEQIKGYTDAIKQIKSITDNIEKTYQDTINSLNIRILEMVNKTEGSFKPVDMSTTRIPLPQHQMNRREVYLVVLKPIGKDKPIYENKYTLVDNSVAGEGNIAFQHYEVILKQGSTYKLKILGDNITQADFTWTMIDPEIATVTDDGTIKGIKVGETSLKVVGKKDHLGNLVTVKVIPSTDDSTVTSADIDKNKEEAGDDVIVGGDDSSSNNSTNTTPGEDIPIDNKTNNNTTNNNNTNNIVTENKNETTETGKDVPKGPIPQTGENITVLVLTVVAALGAGVFAIAKHSMKDVM